MLVRRFRVSRSLLHARQPTDVRGNRRVSMMEDPRVNCALVLATCRKLRMRMPYSQKEALIVGIRQLDSHSFAPGSQHQSSKKHKLMTTPAQHCARLLTQRWVTFFTLPSHLIHCPSSCCIEFLRGCSYLSLSCSAGSTPTYTQAVYSLHRSIVKICTSIHFTCNSLIFTC